jgi:hypothetical protein
MFSSGSLARVSNTAMSAVARKVYKDEVDIARIEGLVLSLPTHARVRVTTRNGDVLTGTVTERPATQIFRGPDGSEGVNALVRLDDPEAPPWNVYLWLSDIEKVENIDAADRRLSS